LTPACLGLGVTICALGAEPVSSAEVPDLSYNKSVAWHIEGAPEVTAMEPTIRGVLARVHVNYPGADGQQVDGFYPGPTYWSPYSVFIRDSATDLPMARYYYGAPTLRSTVEEFLRLQYPDGSISATVGPALQVDKATVVSDEETSAIVAAIEAYNAMPDPAWLKQPIRGQTLIERLNRAMEWVMGQRRDPATRLIKRAHTTDWGDIKWEAHKDPTHMLPGDQWTVSIYDQAIGYAALQGLARLNAAAGREQDRIRWETEAHDLRGSTNVILWLGDEDRGYYQIHKHVAPNRVIHDFPEEDVIAIGNAAAVFYGLAEPDKVPRILAALERARIQARAPKPGLTLQPAYPGWSHVQMDERAYQNGAIWDWWGGRQISAEFWSGHWRLAREHLMMVARDWATHPGTVREWESPWHGRTGADQAYAGAASVVGQSIVEGLFGVEIAGRDVRLTPRLEHLAGGIRVYEPSTDLYAAYEYQATERGEAITYGSNSPTALTIRLPVRWRRGETRARLDGKDYLPIDYQIVGEVMTGTVIVPSGTHRVDLFEVPTGRPRF
jgi:hypothetical protein